MEKFGLGPPSAPLGSGSHRLLLEVRTLVSACCLDAVTPTEAGSPPRPLTLAGLPLHG